MSHTSPRAQKLNETRENPKILLVYLHGFLGQGSDGDMILSSVKDLSKSEIVTFSPDLFSPVGEWNLSHFNFQNWIAKFNDHLLNLKNDHKADKLMIIGYSMGGRLALNLIAQLQSCIDRAVLLSTHFGIFEESQKVSRKEWDHNWSEKFRRTPWQELLKQWNELDVFQGDITLDRLEESYSRVALASAFENFSPRQHRFELEELKKLRRRLLWCMGYEDVKYRKLLEEIRRIGIPGDTYLAMGEGHRLGFVEHKPLFEKIVKFLEFPFP
jgi:2-succinyl-6-hydroxy-2,4-cyclohexadiene-1-carboxylate synthase